MANSVDPYQTAPIGAVCPRAMLFASILNLSVMFGNYLQQTTSADDIFRCIFNGALRVYLIVFASVPSGFEPACQRYQSNRATNCRSSYPGAPASICSFVILSPMFLSCLCARVFVRLYSHDSFFWCHGLAYDCSISAMTCDFLQCGILT